MTAQAELPKPRVTPDPEARFWRIDYGNGATGRVSQVWCMRSECWLGEWSWSVTLPDGSTESGRCYSQGLAWTCAYRTAAQASSPGAVFSRKELDAMAQAAESDSLEAAKAYRKIIRKRLGYAMSVKCSRTNTSCWVDISTSPRRAKAGLADHDMAMLSALLGKIVTGSDLSVSPCKGMRASFVYRLAGHPVPSDLRIAAPAWD